MIDVSLGSRVGQSMRVLALGAHADDIEIGCGGTILALLAVRPDVQVRWVVFSAEGARAAEARRSAALFLEDAAGRAIEVHDFRDGFLPWEGAGVKEVFEELKGYEPDLVLTHRAQDAHQDHRLVSDLTWNTFRRHLILEYEIPKYDGDLGAPNVFAPVSLGARRRKVDHLMQSFPTQRSKSWFGRETFDALMRLRGIECASPTGYAEGFYCRKLTLGLGLAAQHTPPLSRVALESW